MVSSWTDCRAILALEAGDFYNAAEEEGVIAKSGNPILIH